MIEAVERNFYAVLAESALLRKQGEEFQGFFVDVATALWGADFEGRRPQGRLGDKKCDGYRVSTKAVFQCYAPRTMEAKTLEKKISDDFDGAKKHFGDRMQEWILVHNDWDELPTTSHEMIISLRENNKEIKIEVWGPRILFQNIMGLEADKLRILFPGVPGAKELLRVNFAEIDALVKLIDQTDPDPSLEVPTAPSQNKISHNDLPEHVAALLRTEQIVANRFAAYFADTSRAEVGNRVSDRFKREYRTRQNLGQDPQQIFHGLIELAGGLDCEPKRRTTVIGLIAYLFHCCDIFEDVQSPELVQ